ncbi:hypothetical protein ANN_02571 [Periplaneta americana]|uniref:DUF4817 domain-containing protein n=1 Tax=Periplaneta americana TaxID=6978 RepID=A0ABQ8TYD3_PERAM|nr:hypothetical protein ANN_02571 [Periplaneta americana]
MDLEEQKYGEGLAGWAEVKIEFTVRKELFYKVGCLESLQWKEGADSSGSETGKPELDDEFPAETHSVSSNVHFTVGDSWGEENGPKSQHHPHHQSHYQSHQHHQQQQQQQQQSQQQMVRSYSHDTNMMVVERDASPPKLSQSETCLDTPRSPVARTTPTKKISVASSPPRDQPPADDETYSTDSNSTVDEEIRRKKRKLFPNFPPTASSPDWRHDPPPSCDVIQQMIIIIIIRGATACEGPRPTRRLLASRPHVEAEVDNHPTRMELSASACRTAPFKSSSLPSKKTLRGHSDSSFRGEGYIQCCVGVRLCDMSSNQELAEIHFMYGKADGNAALALRLYQEKYPQRQCPDRKTFVRLHYHLCEYGKFNSPGLGRGRPRSTTPEVQEEILEAVNMIPSISTRRVALQVNVPHTTVWRLLKEYQLYPYHLQRVQALSPADYSARVRFCQWFLQQCCVNPNFPALVLFTDEAQFTRDDITNFHNQHVWAYENPCATVPSLHPVRFSLNMWAGIIGDRLVGPHVLVNRLTGQAYTNFLENTIPPHVLEDTPLINHQHIHFLHDGAPAHFSRMARGYLDRRFPDRWIGRGGPIAWPPRSPDLNPLDFYLWGHLKSLVFFKHPVYINFIVFYLLLSKHPVQL